MSPDRDKRDTYRDMPSATNRAWGESRDPGDQSFGTREQGGWGDFREDARPARDGRQARDEPADRSVRTDTDADPESFGPPGRAVRSGLDQRGSAFSSSSKVVDAARGTEADWPNDQPLPETTRPGRDDR